MPTVIAGHLAAAGYPDAAFAEIVCLLNVDKVAIAIAAAVAVAQLRGRLYELHPVHRSPAAADRRAALESRYEPSTGPFTVPARTAVVFVAP